MTFASQERHALAAALKHFGPEAPTLCEGWTCRDMAAHLYIREHQPLSAAGMFVSKLEPRLDMAMAEQKRRDYHELIDDWAEGPGRLNPLRFAERFMNTAEHFVHHEDVRRANGEGPRKLTGDNAQQLHKALKLMAPRFLGKSEVPVVLEPAGLPRIVAKDERGVSLQGDAVAHVRGEVGEIVLWVFGRDCAEVELIGPKEQIRRSSI